MGITHILATVKNLKDERRKDSAKFLVDTGANYTLIPKSFVKKLGLLPTRKQIFVLADGEEVERKIGRALVEINGHSEPTTVILGEKGDNGLLGVVTLEQMGLMVDPFKRKLRPIKLMLANFKEK